MMKGLRTANDLENAAGEAMGRIPIITGELPGPHKSLFLLN